MNVTGIHHVSAITAKAEENYDFFTRVLGMRLVKKTVNQDSTSSYHLFYADAVGSAGTDMTYFDIPMAGRTHPGVSSISNTAFRVPTTESLHYWKDRFVELKVKHEEIQTRANRDTLYFEDNEGSRLMLVADNGEQGVAPGIPWTGAGIPKEHAIVGLGPVTLTVRYADRTIDALSVPASVSSVPSSSTTSSDASLLSVSGSVAVSVSLQAPNNPKASNKLIIHFQFFISFSS